MPPPSSTSCLPADAFVTVKDAGEWSLSPALTNLFRAARSGYDWPSGTGAVVSQRTIQSLEASVAARMRNLSESDATQIAIDVSAWAGNNWRSHRRLINASSADKALIRQAISDLANRTTVQRGVETLCGIPGLSLVIATKIFRFCVPDVGAAVDRHSSYFMNSLPTSDGVASRFLREWTNAERRATRLATYSPARLRVNMDEYLRGYIPLLATIASELNSADSLFVCAVTGARSLWRPTDVEMAAYYWWARHGAR
jgi:hypothetical protein